MEADEEAKLGRINEERRIRGKKPLDIAKKKDETADEEKSGSVERSF